MSVEWFLLLRQILFIGCSFPIAYWIRANKYCPTKCSSFSINRKNAWVSRWSSSFSSFSSFACSFRFSSSQLILFSTVGGSFFVYGLYVCMCVVHSFSSKIVLNKFHNVAIFIEAFILIHNKMKPLKKFQHHHYSVRSTDAICVRQL